MASTNGGGHGGKPGNSARKIAIQRRDRARTSLGKMSLREYFGVKVYSVVL